MKKLSSTELKPIHGGILAKLGRLVLTPGRLCDQELQRVCGFERNYLTNEPEFVCKEKWVTVCTG